MPLKIVRHDITKMEVDAIVNAANSSLLGGGGVDGAIHLAAGPKLLAECRKLGGCKVGEAKLTRGYNLPCRFVIHTVGPVWQGGKAGEEELLRSCYRSALAIAKGRHCKSVAFPLISAGAYGYPKGAAMRVASEEIRAFLTQEDNGDLMVYLVVFDRDTTRISESLYPDMESYIDDHYVLSHRITNVSHLSDEALSDMARRDIMSRQAAQLERERRDAARRRSAEVNEFAEAERYVQPQDLPTYSAAPKMAPAASDSRPSSIEDVLKNMDEGFAASLLRRIDASGMTDPQCYNKANIDRKLFSKIKNQKNYRPGKQTVLAFCIALELPLRDAEDLLRRAGYALSPADMGDVIVRYFIEKGKFDIDEINTVLFDHDQRLLGA